MMTCKSQWRLCLQVKLLKDKFAYDAAFNYKTCKDYRATLQELCPDGIDVYFENVGGKVCGDKLLPGQPCTCDPLPGHLI